MTACCGGVRHALSPPERLRLAAINRKYTHVRHWSVLFHLEGDQGACYQYATFFWPVVLQMKNLIALMALALSALMPAHAATVAGVDLDPKITVQGQALDYYGAGIRSKYFMKLYVGALYAQQAGLDAEGVLDSDKLTAVRLNILSGMITSERMIDTIEEGFETATNGNVAPLRDRLDNFMAVFDAPVQVGDQFTMVSIPGVGLEAYKNGQLLTLVEGDDFRRALFAIWLGDKPADKKLKAAMLGE